MSTAIEIITDPGETGVDTAPSVRQLPTTYRAPTLLRPVADAGAIVAAQEETRKFIEQALTDGRDFGTFPGVDKKSLFKAGAERVCAAFNVYPRFRIVEKESDHDREVTWRKVKAKYEGPRGNRRKVGEDVTDGVSLGLYRYVVECELIDRSTGLVVGTAIGACSTLESKYIDRPRDAENTVLQMAEKRAHVAATRTTFGLSEQFTQDIEDDPDRYSKGAAADDPDAVKCPKCSGPCWDNREKNDEREKEGKKRMPDYKCKDTKCETVIWSAAEYAAKLAENDALGAEGEQRADPTSASKSGSSATVSNGSGSSGPAPTTNSSRATPRSTTPNAPAAEAAPKPSREKVMPFGKTKGKKLGELTVDELVGARNWAFDNNPTRFADFIAAADEVLEEKRLAELPPRTYRPGDDEPETFPLALHDGTDDLPF